MEEGVPADEVRLGLEDEAALSLDCLKHGQALEAPIGERLIGQGPEMLCWLQLRRIRRQECEVDALGDADLLAGVPARAIKNQDDALAGTGTNIPGKGGEHLPEERRRHGGEQPPLGLTRRGTNEATDVEPLVALLHGRDRSPADGRPHLPNEREQANPMLIGGPELDLGIRVGGADRLYPVAELS